MSERKSVTNEQGVRTEQARREERNYVKIKGGETSEKRRKR